jgi:hypothetical protein
MVASTDKRFKLRIFRDDEVTEVWYENVTHVFWTNHGRVLTICLPDDNRHANWLESQISHYDIWEM